MDITKLLTEYKEIIVALIAVFGVVIPYLVQRNKEYKLKISEQKIVAYSQFLQDFTETTITIMHGRNASGKEFDRKRISARNQLLLYGSDDVVKAYDNWVRYSDSNPDAAGTNKDTELFGILLLQIRRDILGKTRLSNRDIDNLNPFIRG